MLAERLCFTILMFLTTPPGTPPPTTEGSGTRKKKCPGCQRTHDDHTFGPPSKNCQGPVSPSSSPSPTDTSRAGRTEQRRQQQTPNPRENPDAGLSSDQIDQYRRHLQFLKDQENELLESIRKDQENQIREENVLRDEIKRQTEKLERLKASRTLSSRSATPPVSSRSEETHSSRSAILNRSSTDTMSTLLHRPLLAQPQQQQTQSHLSGSSFDVAASLPHLNSGLASQDSLLANRPISHNELFLRPTRANDVTRGKALRIIDFVSRIRPAEDEKVLSYDN
eukprot:TCONS_00039964-protein